LEHINELVAEEHELRKLTEHSEETRARVAHLEEQLDQAWDLLRQRRAHSHVEGDVDTSHERSVKVVESYEQ